MSTEIVPAAIKVVKQLARKRTLAAAIVAIFLYIVFGHWLLDAVFAVILVAMLATLTYVAIKARELGKPAPLDYSLIARMERDVWGETFEHAGAPAAAATRSVTRANCLSCGSPNPRVRGRCTDCDWRRRRYQNDLQIVALAETGMRPVEIADLLGVSNQTIRRIVQNGANAGE